MIQITPEDIELCELAMLAEHYSDQYALAKYRQELRNGSENSLANAVVEETTTDT